MVRANPGQRFSFLHMLAMYFGASSVVILDALTDGVFSMTWTYTLIVSTWCGTCTFQIIGSFHVGADDGAVLTGE